MKVLWNFVPSRYVLQCENSILLGIAGEMEQELKLLYRFRSEYENSFVVKNLLLLLFKIWKLEKYIIKKSEDFFTFLNKNVNNFYTILLLIINFRNILDVSNHPGLRVLTQTLISLP